MNSQSLSVNLPTTKAIVVVELKKAAVRDVLMPIVRDGWVLVKIKAIGINPTDWKHIAYGAADVGCRVGCEYAGIVEEVGSKVTNLKKGDRITGWIHGSNRANHESGAFAEYAIAKASVQRKIPDNLSFEEAATLGVAIMTVGQGMYKRLNLPVPTEPAKEPFPILIYGGSTATGMAGIQFAKLSGLTVITTCSPHNFDLVTFLGADAVFDYKSPTCASDIKKLTGNRLKYAWDCTGDGAGICAAAMCDSEPGVYGTIMPSDYDLLKKTNPMVHGQEFMRGYDTMGEYYCWLGQTPITPDPEEMKFYQFFLELTQPLLENGSIKPVNFVVNKTGSGLEGALKGLEEMQAGNVSGVKLIYTL
ncbi:alcohol dehydrogenase, putative [Talaromyces stipitatus ATCC 10500]|uniref:Alcohol dehydrogenase, putative n=1 Tax=Talaromyces stipitatus (strain ATCC 10500 / CBS 375.48 / QM 6759 / NRRL 1006) TaxID=441959 RepID=B8MLS0_TALSN|nr:alcohol dehydrogenase, putative [Talaromyces stipitatus ATCC 10500]EED13642.1 alcohol dehydrogenase, putative [Talaromyces stipitatus ATCC 10500]